MKRETTKAIVNNVTGYGVAAASSLFFAANRRHSDNKAVELAIDSATFVTAFAVSGAVHEKVRDYTDRQIDSFYDNRSFLNKLKK